MNVSYEELQEKLAAYESHFTPERRDVFYSEVEYFCPECGKTTKVVKPQITVEPGSRFTCQHCGVGYEIEYRQYINLPQEKEEQK